MRALWLRKEAWHCAGRGASGATADHEAEDKHEDTTLRASASCESGITATTLGGPRFVPVKASASVWRAEAAQGGRLTYTSGQPGVVQLLLTQL